MTTLNDLLALLPDNNTGDIDASDLRAIVTALWERAAGSLAGNWQINPQVGANPGGGQVTSESGDSTGAWLRFATQDKNNIDFTGIAGASSTIIGQQSQNAANFAVWDITGAVTSGSGYFEVPVSVTQLGGSLDLAAWQDGIFIFNIGGTP